MMTAPRPAVYLIAALGLLVAGCNGSNTVESSGGAMREVSPPLELVAQARPPILDLPVPIGFELDEGRSRNFAAAGARYVDHLYKGGGDRFAVGRFYKRHMPISRWALVTDMFVQGDIVLDFEKETERCRIVASKGSLFHSTYIKVQLWTTGRIQAPAQKGSKRGSGK
jgi:hypothetical protein